MALAQIIDLGERRARRAAARAPSFAPAMGPSNDAMVSPWFYCWMPMSMYCWYAA